ncbi:hypothetical protein [Phytoactinopolyspora mesophila]|nr:hypothetical protein [Phytoactinopolyspora mesophila]
MRWAVRNWLDRFRVDVAGRGPDDLAVRGFLRSVGGPTPAARPD